MWKNTRTGVRGNKDGVQSGESVQADSKYRLIILTARPSKLTAPISFKPGQRLRYTFFHPNDEGRQPVSVQASVYDSAGNLVTQTDPAKVEPGTVHIIDVDRDNLPVAGEALTGRLQVSAVIQAVLMDGSVRNVKYQVSMEIVEKDTGKTTGGGNYFTGSVTVSDD